MKNTKKPVIGITGPSQFTAQVREMVSDFFGSIPLDINQNGYNDLKQIAEVCDGFIFAGGVDLFPATLDREILTGKGYSKFDRKRDLREINLIKIAGEQGKSIFGICRGHQMLLSNRGLYLIPDISGISDVCHSPREIETNNEPIHFVRGIGKGVAEFGERELVNSYHHQAILYGDKAKQNKEVEILGISSVSFARGENTGVKIVELARGDGFLSCQWHPELDWKNVESSKKVLTMAKKMFNIE